MMARSGLRAKRVWGVPSLLNYHFCKRTKFWLLALLLIGVFSSQAQANLAAVLRVTFPGVEIRRANTERWIELQEDAIAPLGIGDTLRTDESGRAYLTFADDIELLVMPLSTYEITQFEMTDGVLMLHATLDGHAIGRTLDTDEILEYVLDIGRFSVHDPQAQLRFGAISKVRT